MERNFNNEFERFLKENADQYRIYPSPKVWSGIYATLHSRRKWFGLGIILLLITGGLITFLVTHSSKETIVSSEKPVVAKSEASSSLVAVSPLDTRIVSNGTPHNTGANSARPVTSTLEGPAMPNEGSIAERTLQNEVVLSPFENDGNFVSATRSANDLDPNTVAIAPNTTLTTVSNATTAVPWSFNVTDEATDQNIVSNNNKPEAINTNNIRPAALFNPYNWTIESVVNSFAKKNNKMSLQFTFTPTVSYRKLSENSAFASTNPNAPPSYAPLYDINSVVTHKPDLGLEFGLAAKYRVTKNVKVKAGLQFNINRYDIKAFNSSVEAARISLRDRSGVDSFYTLSTHRNFNGYKSDWLENFYFEISMPVGLEVNLVGDDKVQFGVGGTIQPTYVLGDRAYLLSNDYKNYALVPWLIRRWNVSTGLETFVAYSTGKVKWQIGPQMRYQLLSSFIAKYPVRENLFDFGLKVGISLTK